MRGRLRAPNVAFDADIPALRCSIPTRQQGDLPADPDVLRTINAHADHCLGVYANVAEAGTLAEGDLLEFEPVRRGLGPGGRRASGHDGAQAWRVAGRRRVDAPRRVTRPALCAARRALM